jgi:hypothetical protein
MRRKLSATNRRGSAGMLKYLCKFALDILPSVLATIIGAYIVNHYITTKPATDAPAAAAASIVPPKKAEVKTDAKTSDAPGVVGSIPEPGVKARGIPEKTTLEKAGAEKPAVAEKPAAEKPVEKSVEKPVETVSVPVDNTRRHQPAPRERAAAKSVAQPVQPSASAAIAAPPVAPIPTADAPEDRRDANELARAAIERLRAAGPKEATRVPDSARAPETIGVVSAPQVTAPVGSSLPVRPLPPPIMVSTPSGETVTTSSGPDPRRPTPPADIPAAGSPLQAPLDLRAEAAQPQTREHTSVAEDVLLAAKSVFHSVLPK